jgi:hypothetical protein
MDVTHCPLLPVKDTIEVGICAYISPKHDNPTKKRIQRMLKKQYKQSICHTLPDETLDLFELSIAQQVILKGEHHQVFTCPIGFCTIRLREDQLRRHFINDHVVPHIPRCRDILTRREGRVKRATVAIKKQQEEETIDEESAKSSDDEEQDIVITTQNNAYQMTPQQLAEDMVNYKHHIFLQLFESLHYQSERDKLICQFNGTTMSIEDVDANVLTRREANVTDMKGIQK